MDITAKIKVSLKFGFEDLSIAINKSNVVIPPLESNVENELISDETLHLVRKILYTGVLPLIHMVGLVSNIICLLVLQKQKKVSIRLLLILLTTADLLINIFGLYTCSLNIGIHYFPNETQTVYITTGVWYIFAYGWIRNAEAWLTTVISVQRLVAVTAPIFTKTHCRMKSLSIFCIFIIVFCGVVQIPALFLFRTKELFLRKNSSLLILVLGPLGQKTSLYEGYIIACDAVFTFLPITLTSVSSGLIIYRLYRSQIDQNCITEENRRDREAQVRDITKTLTAISLTFVFCLTPYAVFRIMKILDPSGATSFPSNIYSLLSVLSYILESINSCTNLFIYIACSKEYRTTFINICRNSPRTDRVKSVYCTRTSASIESTLTT